MPIAVRLPAWYPRTVLLPYAVTRLLLVAALLLGTRALPFNALYPGDQWPTPFAVLNGLARWDGPWYVNIAASGYSYQAGTQSNVAFSPLLPLLMHVLSAPFGDNQTALYLAGVLVSNLALVVALGFLVALVRDLIDEPTAARAALYLLVFPTSFFLSALYPHTLFLALGLGSVYFGRRQRWWVAGGLAVLAAFARPYGALVAVPLVWDYVARLRAGQQKLDVSVVSLGLAPLAMLAWTVYLWTLTGGPSGLAESSVVWGRYPIAPWAAAERLLSLARLDFSVAGPAAWLDGGLALLFIPLVVAGWRRGAPALAAFGSLLFGVLISTSQLLSVSRYLLEVVPAFVVLASLGRRKPFHWAYLTVSGAAALGLFVEYALGYGIA